MIDHFQPPILDISNIDNEIKPRMQTEVVNIYNN